MGINKFLMILFIFIGVSACGTKNSSVKEFTHKNRGNVELDSISFERVDKPDWIDFGSYPKEIIVISLLDGNFSLTRDTTSIKQGFLSKEELIILEELLHDLSENHINKIYNASAPWLTDLELYVYATDSENSFMIKSFGQHGDNPNEVIELYSFLLRKMRNEFSLHGRSVRN